MSFADTQEPPSKKRRFFTEKSETLNPSLADDFSFPNQVDAFTGESTPAEEPRQEGPDTFGEFKPRKSSDDRDGQYQDEGPDSGFDQETFESFIGDKVAEQVLNRLREASGDNLERAVNMYFDGSWQDSAMVSEPHDDGLKSRPSTVKGFVKPGSSTASTAKIKPAASSSSPRQDLQKMPEFRYIGAFGVGGWATRSGTSLVKHGEVVHIERQKIQPPKAPIQKGRGRPATAQTLPKPNSAAARRVDVIVRFTNSKGEEIGRLPKETANWVSTLIDQKVCKFEGTCVYAPERIRTNDTIFLQLRCSLLMSAFFSQGFKLPENRTTGLFEEKESTEEKELRLRQVALVKLFDEVNLLPSRTSETTAKHKRQGLLQATEVAEQQEKDEGQKAKSAENGGSSPPSEEVEDGKELEQDQLDTLYRKAQSFDFDAPEAEPAETFAMDLRPYQKQALHWMMSKEKDEKGKSSSSHVTSSYQLRTLT